MELGPFVPDVHNINAHRHLVCFTVRLLFKSNFPCRPTLTARPTIPTARPNVPPGAVTRGITNPGQAAFRKRKPVPITGMKTVLKLVLV